MRKLLILLFISAIAYAQPSNPPIVLVVTAPSGACASGLPDQQVISTGVLYSCQAGIWGIIPTGTSGSVAFSGITSGTNTTAAMVVGTGASLSVPTNPNSGDSSTQAASNQFVGNAINFSQSRFALNITGGTYSFDSQGSGAQVVIFVSGGAVSSVITTANPGSGYAVGDLLFIPPGGAVGGNGDAVIRVTSVSGTGFAGGQVLYGGTGYTATGLGSTTSAASGRPFTFIWQGAIASNVQIIMKFGTYLTTSNQWIMANNTTGAFTVNVCEGNASDVCSGGLTVNVAQGTNNSRQVILETDGELNIFLAAVQNFMDLTGTSDVPLLNADNTWSGTSVASTPVFNLTTAPFAGSATNSYPYLFWNTGTTPTNFSTFGTYWGVNCASGTPTVFQAWLNGASNVSLTCGGTLTVGGIMANTIATQANCSNSASPAVCAAAAAGSVVVAATATTVTVNTTRVTASSLIFLTFDSSLGTKNGVTCNTTFSQPFVTGRVAGTSFTATVSVAPVTNPLCFSYLIVN